MVQFTNILGFTLIYLLKEKAFGFYNECGLQDIVCNWYDEYRSVTGACNNLRNPNWGTADCTYDRLVYPTYAWDGSLPTAISGNPLPNARNLSVNIFTDNTLPHPKVTASCMQYGQLIAHDMSFNALEINPGACCTLNLQHLDTPSKKCASVNVFPSDPFYGALNMTCISVVKTTTNRDLRCSEYIPYPEQISATNAYLDLSVIYSCNDEDHSKLKSNINGTLLLDERNGKEWLLKSINNENCPFSNPEHRCYLAGDSRVDQNPELCILHIVWAREHNRIARTLKKLNPHWSDEIVFQESRKIVIAEHQYIIYYELLPLYLGRKNMLESKIIYNNLGFNNDYDEEMRPNVYNEHAQAAFRHFHSMINGNLDLVNSEGSTYRSINLRDTFNSPHFIEEEESFDGLLRGMNTQPSRASDIYIVPEMTRFLFLIYGKYSFDIKAIDIQRARDHRLGSYNDMREFCGLGRASHFYDFLDVMTKDRVEIIQSHYEHPDDVDLIIGGNLETIVEGTLSGPTFMCIMLRQFYRTRRADRFWFENQQSGFTYEQLKEIRKASISKLFCDNGNSIYFMQKHGFLQVSERVTLAVAVSGRPLPNPRNLTVYTTGEKHVQDAKFTLSYMQYGEFIAHDMSGNLISVVRVIKIKITYVLYEPDRNYVKIIPLT